MDFTSLWVFWQRHASHALAVTACLLAFIIGWYTHEVVSPYSQATPIVFEELTTSQTPPETTEGVEVLKQAGIAARATTAPTVAGSTTPKQPTTFGDATFVASKNSTLYHHITCAAAKRISQVNLVRFKSQEEAQRAGFKPSVCTIEKGL